MSESVGAEYQRERGRSRKGAGFSGNHLSWAPLVSEILMLPPFLHWLYLQIMLAWNLCGKRDAGQEKQVAEDKAENRGKGKENRMMKIPL